MATLPRFNKEVSEDETFKEEFIAMIAHEMKNVLSPITSYSSLLLNEKFGSLNDTQKERLTIIYDSSTRLNKLVKDVLDFQKIGLGQLKILKKENELENLCKDAVLEVSVISDLKNIKINSNVDSTIIKCDYDRILQVLNNLINNAIKHSPMDSIIILNAVIDGKNILFEVIDHGKGIKKIDLPRVFKKFEQAERGKSLQTEGSGLGLAICKGLVKLHDGAIWIESTYNKGTKASFTIPV